MIHVVLCFFGYGITWLVEDSWGGWEWKL